MTIFSPLTIILLVFALRTNSQNSLEIDEIALNMMLMGQTMPMEQLVPAVGIIVKDIVLTSNAESTVSPELAAALRRKVLRFVDKDDEKRDKIRLALKEAEEVGNKTARTITSNDEVKKNIEDEVMMIFARVLDEL